MGTITFQLPVGLPDAAVRELERTCMAGGPDNMPWAAQLQIRSGHLTIRRTVEESGYLVAPWSINGFGQLIGTSGTLTERIAPYRLLIELARGKVNQVRCQAADWQTAGLQIAPELRSLIAQASHTFGQAVCSDNLEESNALAQEALDLAHAAAHSLVRAYIDQVFRFRHQRQPALDTWLSCRPGLVVRPAHAEAFSQTFNRVNVPMSWHLIEADETVYRWGAIDRLVDWAEAQGLPLTAGPLIDFSSSQLPAWLWLWEQDVPSIATFLCRFVEAAIRRYRGRIRRWHLTAGSNWAAVLGLTEDDLMGLTFRLGETARQVDPSLELVIGVSQPWGEYMTRDERTYSPFIFADNLIRSGLNLTALDVELVTGVTSRGSYCRDLLETSRLLDLYALMGVPLQVTLGYPASADPDPDADPELTTGAGHWRTGYNPETQAAWASDFVALALCKPYVQAVQWAHFDDADPHLFPGCGLIDHKGTARPALTSLKRLRTEHLK